MKKTLQLVSLLLLTSFTFGQSNDLVLDYKFNDSIDGTIYKNNFINHNATYTEDRFGNPNSAMAFNGSTSWLEIPSDTSYQVTKFPFSISVWYKYDSTSNSSNFFSTGDVLNNYGGVRLGVGKSSNNGNIFAATIGDGNGAGVNDRSTLYSSSSDIKANQWQNAIVVIKSLNDMDFYINGVKTLNPRTSGNGNSFGYPSGNVLGIIGKTVTVSSNLYFKGTLDDLKMWTKELSSQEALDLYNKEKVLGFFSSEEESTINFFPNPVRDLMNFNEGLTSIKIFNTSGIQSLELNNASSIDVSSLSNGFYVLKAINNHNKPVQIRFIKQ